MTTTNVDVTNVETYQQGDHVEAAAPTHGGTCPTCLTQATGPAWDWIENGVIKGTRASQCGGCGQLGSGWVHTGARQLPADPTDHEAFVTALTVECAGRRDAEHAHIRSQIRGDLTDRLAAAVAAKPAGTYKDDEDEWYDWFRDHNVSWDNSGGDGPIFLDVDGNVTAWTYDPADSSEWIEVTVDDLTPA